MHPKIIDVIAKDNYVLIVAFDNQITKKITLLDKLEDVRFSGLKDSSFFKTVKVDAGGYGISWNDEIDMSEYELWNTGEVYHH